MTTVMGMWRDIGLLVLGAVIGVGADRFWDLAARTSGNRRTANKRGQRLRTETNIRDQILSFYDDRGFGDHLYVPKNIPLGRVPMLAFPGAPGLAISSAEFGLTMTSTLRVPMHVDRAAIARREAAGGRLWDGDLLYLCHAKMPPVAMDGSWQGMPELETGVTNYFSFVTAADEWRKEATNLASDQLLRAHYRDLDTLLTKPPSPLALSAAAVCVFHTAQGSLFPLAMRSDEVVNAMGALSLVPTFGLEPNTKGIAFSRFDLLKYNFLKEFVEEMYGMSEAEHNADSGRLHPDSIFETAEGTRLCAEFDDGRATLLVTGISGELTDGSLTLSLLAEFSSEEFFEEVLQAARPSWEWQPIPGSHQHVQFYPLSALKGEAGAIQLSSLAHSAAFSLDRALEVLEQRVGRE